MSMHLSLSKLLSWKYAVIVHLIQPQLNTMFHWSIQQSDMCWDCDPVGRESCKTCTKEKWQTNRCSGLLASSLCGTSAAPRKEMEHLGRHSEPPRPYRHTIVLLVRGFMFFVSLNSHQTPHWGDGHGLQRKYGSVMNGSPLWSCLGFPPLKPGLHLPSEACKSPTDGALHLDTMRLP